MRRKANMVEADNASGSGTIQNGCAEHNYEQIKGFCKDCSVGICFRCAIGKHRNHNMVNCDELTKSDLEPMLTSFDNKIDQLKEKASKLLEKTRNQETNSEKLPEIIAYFNKIKQKFVEGTYKEMILGELERNFEQIKNMHFKLEREERED